MAGKILIIEDDSRLAEVLAVNLNEAGYETSWAANSSQGISKAITELPDLILTDLNLPDIIAVEAIPILKHIPITSKILLLFSQPTLLVDGNQEHSKLGSGLYP